MKTPAIQEQHDADSVAELARIQTRQAQEAADALEAMVDRYGLARTLEVLGDVCMGKASHVEETWQDYGLARAWGLAGSYMYTVSGSKRVNALP